MVALGEIEVGEMMHEPSERPSVYFELTSVKIRMGCVGHGTLAAGVSRGNGNTAP